MVQLDIEGTSENQITWADLTNQEIEAIIEVTRLIEQRLQTGGSLTSAKRLQLSQEIETLHTQLAKRYSNLYRLQEQASDYGASQIPLHLLNGMANEENAIADLEERLQRARNS